MTVGYRLLLFVLVVSLAGALIWSANHYHRKYMTEQKRADDAELLAQQRQQTINDMQTRQHDVAALDSKYTQELADAKQTIEQLQRDVAAGDKRLRLNATCQPVRAATSAPGVDDATGPGLTDAAERDYFRLRERIETSNKQIAGLQDYVKKQCGN
ncbi:lysis protein [Enterobacter sp. TMH.L2]